MFFFQRSTLYVFKIF